MYGLCKQIGCERLTFWKKQFCTICLHGELRWKCETCDKILDNVHYSIRKKKCTECSRYKANRVRKIRTPEEARHIMSLTSKLWRARHPERQAAYLRKWRENHNPKTK